MRSQMRLTLITLLWRLYPTTIAQGEGVTERGVPLSSAPAPVPGESPTVPATVHPLILGYKTTLPKSTVVEPIKSTRAPPLPPHRHLPQAIAHLAPPPSLAPLPLNTTSPLPITKAPAQTTTPAVPSSTHSPKPVATSPPSTPSAPPRTPSPTNSSTPLTPFPPDSPSDEYYSAYPDYPDSLLPFNNSGVVGGVSYRESAVLPDPDLGPPEDPLPEVQLPDDSLADTDLHDHDLIDSVMYIYFGASSRDQGGTGRQVLIVGAVIGLVAQFLTLASGLRRVRTKSDDSALVILLNTELALTLTNLLFMLGVQATGDRAQCEVVAVSLHYLHLVCCVWFLANCLHVYRRMSVPANPRLLLHSLLVWTLPALPVYVSWLLNRRGYETRDYCWMSLQRGMLYSFMIPVTILLLVNTVLAILGQRRLEKSFKEQENTNEENSLSERRSLRVAASLLPLFAISWFLGVLALENSSSLVFPLLFVAVSGFLNWFIFIFWLPTDLSAWRSSDEDYEEEEEDLYEEPTKPHSDDQPLLHEVYVCGRRDDYDLPMDPIATISS